MYIHTLITTLFPDMEGACAKREEWIFELISEGAQAPTYETTGAVGADLYAPQDVTLGSLSTTVVPLGLATRAPSGHFCRIAGRSGLAGRHGIYAFNGVIDPDYVGEVKLIMFNSSPIPYLIKKGQRIAQIICERYDRPPIVMGTLPPVDSNRKGGIGSTGY